MRGTKTSPSCGRVVGIRSIVAIPVDDDNHVLDYQCVCAGRSLILAAAVADWLSIQKSRRLIRCQNNTRLRLRLQSTTVLPAHRSLRFSVSTTLSSTQSSQWSTKSSSGAASVRTPNLPNTSNPILTTTNHYRPRSPLLATRHRNASLLQQRIPLGVAPLRRRGRKFRILVDRGREQTDENIGGEAE